MQDFLSLLYRFIGEPKNGGESWWRGRGEGEGNYREIGLGEDGRDGWL